MQDGDRYPAEGQRRRRRRRTEEELRPKSVSAPESPPAKSCARPAEHMIVSTQMGGHVQILYEPHSAYIEPSCVNIEEQDIYIVEQATFPNLAPFLTH